MQKRMFQILDEMNVADGENGTTHLVVCDQLIEARTAKGGGHVTVGVPAEVIHWLTFNSENTKAVLLIIDFDEYKRRAVAVSPAPSTDLEATQKLLHEKINATQPTGGGEQ